MQKSQSAFSRRRLFMGAGAGLFASSLPVRAQGGMGMMDMNTYQPANTFAHFAYGQMAGGAYWKTSFMFINNGGAAGSAQLLTWGTSGAPMSVAMMGGAMGSQHVYDIPPGGSLLVELDENAGNMMTGWAGVVMNGPIAGQGIFRLHNPGQPDFEAAVPLMMRGQTGCVTPPAALAMPFDNSNGYVTSVAFANTAIADRMLDLEFLDSTGAGIFTAHESMAAHNQMSFETPTRYPAVAGKRGWMRVLNTPADFTCLGFRFNPNGPFTTWLPLPAV
jgi:hypothetical protein